MKTINYHKAKGHPLILNFHLELNYIPGGFVNADVIINGVRPIMSMT